MKKYGISLFLLSLLPGSFIYSQQSEPLLAKVYYTFIHQYDKSDSSRQFNTDVLLLIGKTNSRYANAKYNNTEPIPEFVAAPKIKPEDMNKVPVVASKPRARISVQSRAVGNEFLFKVPKKNKFIMIGTLGYQDYRVETPLPAIDWQISSDTMVIGPYTCQKAVGSFGGRTYTAWFAPDLPFSYGPWKLGGLPGLILQAVDTENQVKFMFKSFAKGENEYLHFEELRPVSLSEERYEKEKAKYEKDPVALSKAQLSSDTEITRITFYDQKGNALRGDAALEAIKEDSKIEITNPLVRKGKK